FHWAVFADLLPLERDLIWVGWVGATVAYWIVLGVTIPRLRRSAGVNTTANRAMGIAWSGMGWGIFAMFLTITVLGLRLGESVLEGMYVLMPSMIMIFYGVGWAVHASMQRSRPLWMLS